jgi:hypothetical protein
MRRWMAGLALWLLAAPCGAEEIGNALRVHPDVQGYGVGEPVRQIRENDPIERGLRVQLRGRDPYLKVAFNFGGCKILEGPQNHQFTGTATLGGASEIDFGDPNDPSASRLRLAAGKLFLALFPEAGCHLDIDTPHAGILIKGTYLRLLVDPVVGTFVAVDEGTVSVQAKAGGMPVEVTAGNWVLVPPGGLPTRPVPLPPDDDDQILQDPPLLGCCTGVEPPKSREGPP